MEAVFKSNRFLETLLVILIMLIPTISMADSTTTIPLTSSYWQSLDIGYGTGTMSTTSDGLKINGVGSRQGAGLRTISTYNMVGATIYIKWKASGSGYMGANAGIEYDYTNDYAYIGIANSGGYLTTDHSYGGSTVISDNTWYYTRIKLNSDQTYTVVTASSNYDDSGGTTLLSYSGTYSGNNWSYFQSEYVFVYLWDNYGGTSAYMVVGEAKVKFSVPLTSSYWQSLDIGYGTGTMSTTSDGMKINGVGYRQGAGLKTSNTYNLVGTETYIKWLAYGSGYMGANAGIFYDMNSTGGEISPAGSAQPLTTDHSYGGSTLISDSTWYYTRIKLNSDQTYTVVTASSNYDNYGGTTIQSSSGTYSGSSWSSYQNARVFVYMWDNYGGTSAYMVVGESVIKYLTSTTTTTATSSTTTTTAISSPTTLTIKKQSTSLSALTGTVTANSGTITWSSSYTTETTTGKYYYTGTATYSNGSSVILTATGGSGSSFSSWGGDCSGTGSTCSLTMSSNKSVTADFVTSTGTSTTTTANTSNAHSQVIYSLPYFHTDSSAVTYCMLSNKSSDNTSAVTFAVKANSSGTPAGTANDVTSLGLYAKMTKMITFNGYSVTFGNSTLNLTSELSNGAFSYGGVLSIYSTGTALNCTNVTLSCFQGTTNPRRNLAGYVCQDNSTAGSGSKNIVVGY